MRNRTERLEYIQKAMLEGANLKDQRIYPVPWRDKTINLTVIRLDLSYLMFWLDNSRTIRQQIQYQQQHQTQPNIFQDPETTVGQEGQFEILKDMLMSTGKDILEDLEKRGQKDPAIITRDGFIINGNRRIAGLRLLGEQYADCVVLPSDAIKTDLYDLEQELQLAQDFKQPYHWVNELLNIEYGLDKLKIPIEGMARRLRIKPTAVTEARRKKYLIDEFLEWRKFPDRYDYIMLDDAEQVFSDLEKFLRTSNYNQEKKEQVKLAVFNLIENRPEEGRLYAHVKNLFKNFDEILKRLAQNDEDSQKSNLTQDKPDEKGDLLEKIVNGGYEKKDDTQVNTELKNPESAGKNSPQLISILTDVMAENRERDNYEALYEGVNRVLRLIIPLSVASNSTKLEETKEKLKSIQKKTSELIEKIEKIT